MSLKVKAVTAGGVLVVGGGMMAQTGSDLATNYTPVSARITAVEVECSIEDSDSRLEDKTTGLLAKMPCTMAPLAARMHDFDEGDIEYHYDVTYRYFSPVDGKRYEGTFTRSRGAADLFERDGIVPVFAHNEKAGASRTSSNNPFVDDAHEI